MLVWDVPFQRLKIITSRLRWDHDVNPVRPSPSVLVQPTQLSVQLLQVVANGTKNSEPSRPRYCRDHVAAVGERENRGLQSELVCQSGLHYLVTLCLADATCTVYHMADEYGILNCATTR